MSNSHRHLDDLLALEQGCRRCGATPGEWCRVPAGYKTAGKPADFLHGTRTWVQRHAHHVGYTRGLEQAYAVVAHDLGADWSPLPKDADRAAILAHVEARLEKATRWAQEAHQSALEDIPEGWRR